MKAVDDPHPNPAVVRHEPNPVGGRDLVITGHCPSLWPTWTRRNVITIDTGVHYEAFGHLTVAEIQDGLTLHRVARTETFPQTEKSHR